jgi:large subunit ribosomal protein L15
MKLSDLSPAEGSKKKRKRVGRGQGSGNGKTAGRGHKGQKSRSGYSQRVGFEGGQMPLIRRVPKRGFTNIFRTEFSVVNLARLAKLEVTELNPESMVELGLVKKGLPVKVLGTGEIGRAMQIVAHKFSTSARAKIEAAGGSCQELNP